MVRREKGVVCSATYIVEVAFEDLSCRVVDLSLHATDTTAAGETAGDLRIHGSVGVK